MVLKLTAISIMHFFPFALIHYPDPFKNCSTKQKYAYFLFEEHALMAKAAGLSKL